ETTRLAGTGGKPPMTSGGSHRRTFTGQFIAFKGTQSSSDRGSGVAGNDGRRNREAHQGDMAHRSVRPADPGGRRRDDGGRAAFGGPPEPASRPGADRDRVGGVYPRHPPRPA